MALGATVNWYVRVGGSNTNGGGYDPGVAGAGVNMADQDAAAFSGSDLTVDASDNTKVIPDGHTPTANDVGNIVRISTNSGGWTYGYYTIIDQDGTAWTLDRSPAAVGTASGAWTMGGAFATCSGAFAVTINTGGTLPSVPSPIASGHTIYVRGSGSDTPGSDDYTEPRYFTSTAGSLTTGRIRMIGVNGRPRIGTNGIGLYNTGYWYMENLIFFANASSQGDANFGLWGTAGCYNNCRFDQNGNDRAGVNNAEAVMACEFCNSGDSSSGANYAIRGANYNALFIGNRVTNWRGGGISIPSTTMGSVAFNLIAGCKGTSRAGISTGSTTTTYGVGILSNTIYGGAGDGLSITDSRGIPRLSILNNIIAGHVGAGKYGIAMAGTQAENDRIIQAMIGQNCLFNNTGNYNGFTGPASDILADPLFVDAANGDFRLQSGSPCKAAGFPGAFPGAGYSGYLDIGAIQRQEAAAASGGAIVMQGLGQIGSGVY